MALSLTSRTANKCLHSSTSRGDGAKALVEWLRRRTLARYFLVSHGGYPRQEGQLLQELAYPLPPHQSGLRSSQGMPQVGKGDKAKQ